VHWNGNENIYSFFIRLQNQLASVTATTHIIQVHNIAPHVRVHKLAQGRNSSSGCNCTRHQKEASSRTNFYGYKSAMQGSEVARSDAMLQAFKHFLVSSFMHEANSSNKNSICYAMKSSVALDKHVIKSSMRADISLPLLVTILASLSHY
jgi:hypothetical protein